MAYKNLNLFQLGARGVNTVTAATHLTDDELTSGQNAELSPDLGEGAIDQRPGMVKLNSTTINSGADILGVHGVPAERIEDLTPVLYAGMYTGSTHNWRYSLDGTTWVDSDTLTKPWSNDSDIVVHTKRYPKCVTIGRYMYFLDQADPIGLHRWDGTTDITISTVPPAASGLTMRTPIIYPTAGYDVFLGQTGAATNTWKYKFVFTGAGGTYSIASAEYSVLGAATLNSSNYIGCNMTNPPPTGVTGVDVYRTVSGGNPASIGLIGRIAVSGGVYTTNNGSAVDATHSFNDAGLAGDAAVPPVAANGTAPGNAIAILDTITDGTNIYLAVLDTANGKASTGRILTFSPLTQTWYQILAEFPITANRGTAGTLLYYWGSIIFGSFNGLETAVPTNIMTAGYPMPFGGFPENHDTANNLMATWMANVNGVLLVGTTCIIAGTQSLILKRVGPTGTWSTASTNGSTSIENGYSSAYMFNGRLYIGYTIADGATPSGILSTSDGVTFPGDLNASATDVVTQMVNFKGSLYVVMGKTGAAYNTTSSIRRRDSLNVWTTVDNPSDDFAGCLGVVYI